MPSSGDSGGGPAKGPGDRTTLQEGAGLAALGLCLAGCVVWVELCYEQKEEGEKAWFVFVGSGMAILLIAAGVFHVLRRKKMP